MEKGLNRYLILSRFMFDGDLFSLGKIISYTHVFTTPLVFGIMIFKYENNNLFLWLSFIYSVIYIGIFFAINDYFKRQLAKKKVKNTYKVYPLVFNDKPKFYILYSGVLLSYVSFIFSIYYYKDLLMLLLSIIRGSGIIYHFVTAKIDKKNIKKELSK